VSKKPSPPKEKNEKGEAVTDFSQTPVNAQLSADQKVALYRMMLRIRRFEERSLRAYQAKKIGGFLHLYVGQEAVAVGCCSLMTAHDHVITAYRDHGHALAVGMDMKSLMAELYGRVTGCSKGKGGSMHFFDPEKNYWGGHGIVGGQVPLGTGLAFALKYKGIKGACMTFMGDGAVNQGAVHEAYNLAALWQLPVVFVIENNGYSMGTSQARSSAGELSKRAEAYGMDWAVCDGHDLYEVRTAIDRQLKLAREQSKPSLLEIRTYRYRGHSVSDPDTTYRRKTEIEEYRRTKDPIQVFHDLLVAEGVLSEETATKIDEAARAESDESANFAEASPYPTTESITQDVYWEEDHPSEKKSRGRIFFE
jgi:pyruvate dehydrogenase E1 component alpha subunit